MATTELVRAEDIARRCAVTPTTIARWRRRGVIPCIRINRTTIRYDVEAVLDALREHAASEPGGAAQS